MIERKPISEALKKPLGEQFTEHLAKVKTLPWVFETPLDKSIVLASIGWSLYSIGRFLWRVII